MPRNLGNVWRSRIYRQFCTILRAEGVHSGKKVDGLEGAFSTKSEFGLLTDRLTGEGIKAMFIFILTVVLMYAIDTFLVGVSFYSLKNRFQWLISSRTSLLILFFIFAFLENYILPVVLVLDITYTVGNTEIANVFNLKPNERLIDLVSFGLFEIITWVVQSLLAAFVGEKIVKKESKESF